MYDNILDEISQEDLAERNLLRLKRQKKRLSYVYYTICMVSGVLTGLVRKTSLEAYEIGYLLGSVIGVFLVSSIMGLVLGSLFSFIPYGGFTYRQRLGKTFLICSLLFSVLFLFAGLGNLLKATH